MDNISDIRMIGFDVNRPPKIQNYPCIFLFFELNHETPPEWCEDFNRLVAKYKYTTKIDPKEGLFIESWVRNSDEINDLFGPLKRVIEQCNVEYIAKVNERAGIKVDTGPVIIVSPAQKELNEVAAALDFEE